MNGRVRVHWNLHRGGYSVSVGGKVVAKPAAICLHSVRFVVSDAGLARMRRLGRRKVVAWAEGEICECAQCPCSDPGDTPTRHVTFNPWRGDRFTDRATGETVEGANHARFVSLDGPDGKPVPQTTIS